MKAIIQRVSEAKVTVDQRTTGEIGKGFLILLGVGEKDGESQARLLATKTANLRIFTDSDDKMNLSLLQVEGGALVVSNFTLCADTKKGNRPSFIGAMEPVRANELYELYCDCLKENGVNLVQKGEFGADMKISMVADGPVTITLDTDIWEKK